MPVVSVNISDLERIARTSLTLGQLEQLLQILKIEIEEIKDDELVYEVSHDRPDLFSAEGLGRVIGALLEKRFNPKYKVVESNWVIDATAAPKYRPYIFGAIIRNLSLDDTAISQIFQLQEKIVTSYGRDREIFSIGIYDLDTIKGPIIFYRTVSGGIYRPLDEPKPLTFVEVLKHTEKGHKYAHLVKQGQYPVLMDSEGRVLALVPILNSEDTRITPRTRHVFIDITGSEPSLMLKILDVLVMSLIERSNDPVIEIVKVYSHDDEYKSPQLSTKRFKLCIDYVKDIVDINISASKAIMLLKKMLLEARPIDDKTLEVKAPPYRIDILEEVDIVEDLLAAYGYNRIPLNKYYLAMHSGSLLSITRLKRFVANILVAMGFIEVVNFNLIDKGFLRDLLGISNEEIVIIANPKLATFNSLRPSLIPSMFQTATANWRKASKFSIFEIGDVIFTEENVTRREHRLGLLLIGDYTLTDMLAVLNTIARELGIGFEYRETTMRPFISERTAEILLYSDRVGVAGEVHPEYLERYDVKVPIVIAELSLSKILQYLLTSRGDQL